MNCIDLSSLTAFDPRQGGRPQRVTLLFAQAAPYAVDLMCPQRERQAFTPDPAPGADRLRLRHLGHGRARRRDREEQIGIGRPAGGRGAPVLVNRQCHESAAGARHGLSVGAPQAVHIIKTSRFRGDPASRSSGGAVPVQSVLRNCGDWGAGLGFYRAEASVGRLRSWLRRLRSVEAERMGLPRSSTLFEGWRCQFFEAFPGETDGVSGERGQVVDEFVVAANGQFFRSDFGGVFRGCCVRCGTAPSCRQYPDGPRWGPCRPDTCHP